MNYNTTLCTPNNQTLAFAKAELERFLPPVLEPSGTSIGRINLAIEPGLENGSFRIQVDASSAPVAITLAGSDAAGTLHAAYSLLEQLGWLFDVTGPSLPRGACGGALAQSWARTIKPAVRWRGIRQHINFTMDISSYSLAEAQEYLRQLARLRFNHISFHSYPGQWHGQPPSQLAGSFFYGGRYEMPESSLVKPFVRNDKIFCMPEAEKDFDNLEARSRIAMDWLRGVMAEAKRVGLRVQYSFEPLGLQPAIAAELADRLVSEYPDIDILELITNETGCYGEIRPGSEAKVALTRILGEEIGKEYHVVKYLGDNQRGLHSYVPDLANTVASVLEIRRRWSGKKRPSLACGAYCAVNGFTQFTVELLRCLLPPEVQWALMPGHGSARVAKNYRQCHQTPAEAARTTLYSWFEFDGLMYLQQNAVRGLRILLEDAAILAGTKEHLPTIAFNHWRSAENRTTVRYAAEACIAGAIPEAIFYQSYAEKLGLSNPLAYAEAMEAVNEAEERAADELPNIGFCVGWDGSELKMLAWQARPVVENVRFHYVKAKNLLKNCLTGTATEEGRIYLEFLINRLECTDLYLQAISQATGLQPLIEGRKPEDISADTRQQVAAITANSAKLLEEYLKTHAQLLPDRGAEGTLISAYFQPYGHLRRILADYGGVKLETAEELCTVNGPPNPIAAAW
jgi:hypothetical protein